MNRFGRLFNKHPWKADFNQCTGRQLVSSLKRIKQKYNADDKEYPIVLIGHSKIFTKTNEKSLIPFLEYVNNNSGSFSFGKFSDFNLNDISQ